jgi:hypothetical protein
MLFLSCTISLVLCLFVSQRAEASFNVPEYKCAVCIPAFELMKRSGYSFQKACTTRFPAEICSEFSIPDTFQVNDKQSSRESCQILNWCSTSDYLATTADLDVRVSKAMGSKGYNQVRISVISNSTIDSELFTYSAPFKYRWTNKYLNTGLVNLTPGQNNHFSIAGKQFDIYLPKENEGVRGLFIADPCFTSEWVDCKYKDDYQTFNHLTEVLNTLSDRSDIAYWQILGDNFYDLAGDASSTWFSALSDATKTKFLFSTPGNHDFWVGSSPTYACPEDQFGNGLMQFYAQDTMAANDQSPFDFSVDPDDSKYNILNNENIPPASNFFFYNKLGNTAFIGYSGAHSFESMKAYFTEACAWAESVDPATVLLVGHWNIVGFGGPWSATVPNVYDELARLPECRNVMPKVKYFMGHKHCNLMTKNDVGYMIGGKPLLQNNDFSEFCLIFIVLFSLLSIRCWNV